jgi:hypothetical protein
MAIAAAVAVTAIGISTTARAAIQTYSQASGDGGVGIDHPGLGFFQFDPGLWDTGLDANPRFNNPAASGGGEFSFSGSDGSFHQETRAIKGAGLTGKTTDHAGFFIMDYNPAPPDHSFGTFWFGGIGNDIGPFPKLNGTPVDFADVLVYADVIAPAGKPMEFRTESNFTSQGNGRKYAFTGTGTWQTVGGTLAGATAFGTFDLNDTQIASLIAFGPNEISAVDDGSDPNNIPQTTIDNLTMTIKQASWTGTAGGNWGDNTKWNIIAPDGANATAVFGGSTAQTINMEFDHFIGNLQLNNAAGYTFSGAGTLALRGVALGTFSGAATLDVQAGSHLISAPVDLYSNTTANVVQAASVTVSNLNPTTTNLSKTGQGTLNVNNVRAGTLSVSGGTLSVIANGTNTGTSRVRSLAITGGSRLDLRDNDLINTGGTYAATAALIASARAGGAWTGSGLTSSTAAAANPHNKTLGTVTGAQFHAAQGAGAQFDGFTVADTDILTKFTYYGDADLNGVVNFDDYSRTDAGFNSGGNTWFQGDFDYNGLVNFDDYSLIDAAFNTQGGTQLRAMAYLSGDDRSEQGMNTPALHLVMQHFDQFGVPYAQGFLNAVPEPTSAALFGVVAAATTCMRRRRRNHH